MIHRYNLGSKNSLTHAVETWKPSTIFSDLYPKRNGTSMRKSSIYTLGAYLELLIMLQIQQTPYDSMVILESISPKNVMDITACLWDRFLNDAHIAVTIFKFIWKCGRAPARAAMRRWQPLPFHFFTRISSMGMFVSLNLVVLSQNSLSLECQMCWSGLQWTCWTAVQLLLENCVLGKISHLCIFESTVVNSRCRLKALHFWGSTVHWQQIAE